MAAAPDVVVVGAGFAGLSAAVRLADAGLRVTVVEQAPRLGGRATAFTDRTTGDRIDNGQHVLFGCYHETYRLLDTIGTAHLAPLDPTLSLVMADVWGRRSMLRCPALPAPWHLAAGLATWDALTLADCWAAGRLLPVIHAARRRGAAAVAAEIPDAMTVADWLESMGQGARARAWLWDPLALAALNQSPSRAAARPCVRVLCELFGGDRRAAAVGVPVVPLDELYAAPAIRFLEAHGATLEKASGRFSPSKRLPTPFVVSAVPWHAFAGLWTEVPPELGDVARAAAATQAESIVSVHLWLDAPTLPDRQFGLVGASFDWAFGAPKKASGTFLDEKGSRRLFRVAMVASGAQHLLRRSNDALIALGIADLRRCLPEAARASVRHAVVVREPRATFSVAPGSPPRPAPGATALPWFFLAGDWTDTGLPGTIEGAVRSGHAAADAVLAAAGPRVGR